MNKHQLPEHLTLYDSDYFLWSQRQAALIRKLEITGLDAENVAEEIESLGKRDRSKLRSQTRRLMTHLLKWQFQPGRRGKSWKSSMSSAREEIEFILADSPSLKTLFKSELVASYEKARQFASDETGLPMEAFPSECAYAEAQLMDWSFLPD